MPGEGPGGPAGLLWLFCRALDSYSHYQPDRVDVRHNSAPHRPNQGCVTRDTMLTMIYKLGRCAEKRWLRIRGFKHLAKVIAGVKFKDGIEVEQEKTDRRNAA